MTLIFQGNMTSSVTRPFDSPYAISYLLLQTDGRIKIKIHVLQTKKYLNTCV